MLGGWSWGGGGAGTNARVSQAVNVIGNTSTGHVSQALFNIAQNIHNLLGRQAEYKEPTRNLQEILRI